jgi:N-acetylmuramoyl-L-alanine amidase
MKKTKGICIAIIIFSMLLPTITYASGGYSGYEGGIAAQQALYGTNVTKINYDYQEVSFISGKAIVFKGILTVSKKLNKETINATYSYKLANLDYTASLTRTLDYTTKIVTKDNGQSIEETKLSKKPVELVKIDKSAYILLNYDFTKTSISDNKPAINYYAGNLHGTKTFQVVSVGATETAAATAGKVIVEETGEFYGYDQYWGTTEVQILDYVIENEQKSGASIDKWGGTANVSLSSTTTKQLKYIANQPNQISFNGGYVQSQHDESVLEYHAKLPQFDSKGVSTDNIIETDKSAKVETFPSQTRLLVPNIDQLKGHWAEDDIRILYSLEVLKGNDSLFNPEQFISRAEFAADLSRAAKEVPPDQSLAKKKTTTAKVKTKEIKLPYIDVSIDNLYYNQIDNVSKRNIMVGTSYNKFSPGEPLMLVDAVTTLIKALGFESMAPNPMPVTTFRDNDKIPEYARRAVYVAENIGLITAAEKGNFNPKQKMTKAKTAQLLNAFINYMREGIRSDYRDKILNYSN